MRWLAALFVVAGCQCVREPDGPYLCNPDTGEDCDGGGVDAGRGDGGSDGGGIGPFPDDLCGGEWCWDHPQPFGRVTLRSVLALAPDDVWAAGGGGNVVHWNGQRWQQVPIGSNQAVQRIWSADRRSVWLVGSGGLVLEWDGERFVRHDAGMVSDWRAVSGFAPREVVLVGLNNAVASYDGRLWGRPVTPPASGHLLSVQAWPDGGVLALGDFGLTREAGPWALVPRPADAGQIACTWAPSRGEVWAAGFAGGLFRNLTGDFTDGGNWQQIDSRTANGLSSVFTLGSHVFWGSGIGGLWESTNAQQLSTRPIYAIHGLAENDVWAVGATTLLHRRVPGAFFEDLTPQSVTSEPLTSIVALPGGGAWATGRNHVLLVRDGGTWSRVRTQGNASGGWYDDVWTAPGAPVIAVGSQPVRLAYWDAGTQEMSAVSLNVPDELWAVWGSSASDIWAAGDNETIVHFDGTDWSVVPRPNICTNNNGLIERVWGTASDDVWFAGADGCVIHWTGAGFVNESLTAGGEALSSVIGRGSDVWVGSHSGRIFRRTGTRMWMPETITSTNVRRLALHEGELYAVGDLGLIAKRDAAGVWVRMPTPIEGNFLLQGIAGAPGEGLYAVGDPGTILRRK